jgi:hypothetical protein
MDPKKAVEVWTKNLLEAGQKLIASTLAGQPPKNYEWAVKLSIPEPLALAIISSCQELGQDPLTVVSQMASEGFQRSINQYLTPRQQSPTKKAQKDVLEELDALGIDTSSIMSQMSELKNVLGQMKGMEEVIEDVGRQLGTDTDAENNKDSG